MGMEETEARYWLEHSPTIAEVRRLNRETLMLFPLDLLNALLDAGVDIEREQEAVIKQHIVLTDQVVECQYAVRLDGKLIALLGEGDYHPDGGMTFRALTKRRHGSRYGLASGQDAVAEPPKDRAGRKHSVSSPWRFSGHSDMRTELYSVIACNGERALVVKHRRNLFTLTVTSRRIGRNRWGTAKEIEADVRHFVEHGELPRDTDGPM